MSNGLRRTWPQRIVRAVVFVAVAAVVIVVLFTQVFPRVEQYFEDPTFDTPAGSAAVVAAATRA